MKPSDIADPVNDLAAATWEVGRLRDAIGDLIGGYESRLAELEKKYALYRFQGDETGCDRISARVNEVQRLIDHLRAIIDGGIKDE